MLDETDRQLVPDYRSSKPGKAKGILREPKDYTATVTDDRRPLKKVVFINVEEKQRSSTSAASSIKHAATLRRQLSEEKQAL